MFRFRFTKILNEKEGQVWHKYHYIYDEESWMYDSDVYMGWCVQDKSPKSKQELRNIINDVWEH